MKGWADSAFEGYFGGRVRSKDAVRGFFKAVMVSSSVVGMVNGASCDGIDGGSGGSDFGADRERRGASRRGSTRLRYDVKTSSTSLACL